ncbi:unnamed protein product [Calicophoron daubneyi]|uniref:Guanylate cyclase n=1 Tax=Calicophoron daubneyi TaxID=300641 RepID=A0AAV2T4N0_CALDB
MHRLEQITPLKMFYFEPVYLFVIFSQLSIVCHAWRMNLQGQIQNPCPSARKDSVLGIDRTRDKPEKILLVGYVTGAAYKPGFDVPNQNYKRAGSMISGTLTYAVNMVNTLRDRFNASERERLDLPEPPLPPGYKIDFCYLETHGNESESIRAVTTLVERVQISAIVGLQETCSVEAAIATSYNIPMISHYCDDISIRGKSFDRARPVFLRTRPQPYDIASAVVTLLEHFNWRKVAYLTTEDQEYAFTIEVIRNTVLRHGIEILYTRSFPYPQLYGLSSNNFKEIVEESFQKVRIYVVIGEPHDSASLLETLKDFGLLKEGNYFVIGIDKRTHDASALHIWSDILPPQDEVDDQNDDIFSGWPRTQEWCVNRDPECYRSYMQLTHTAPVTEKCSLLREYNQCYLKKPPFNFTLSSTNFNLEPEAGYLVDALWLYATAAGEILRAGGTLEDVRNGDKIADKLINRRYVSSLGYINEINERGDAQGNYTVIMGVTEKPGEIPYNSGCEYLPGTQNSPEWYDRQTPLLPLDCRELPNDQNKQQPSHTVASHRLKSRNRTSPITGREMTTTSNVVRLVFRPVGMFYPLQEHGELGKPVRGKNSQTSGDSLNGSSSSEEEEAMKRNAPRTSELSRNVRSPDIATISPSDERNSQQKITYDFSGTLPLMSKLGERRKNYVFSVLQGRQINWISGRSPLDEPPCGFDGSKCRQKSNRALEISLALLSTIVVVLFISGIFIYRNHKFEQELERLLWKVDYRDIVLRRKSSTASKAACQLDQPEALKVKKISRTHSQSDIGRGDRKPYSVAMVTESIQNEVLQVQRQRRKSVVQPSEQSSPVMRTCGEPVCPPNSSVYSVPSTVCIGLDQQPPTSLIQQMVGGSDKTALHLPKVSVDASCEIGVREVKKRARNEAHSGIFPPSIFHRQHTLPTNAARSHVTATGQRQAGGEYLPSGIYGSSNYQKKFFEPATVIGYYKRQLVVVHRINIPCPNINRDVKKSLKLLHDVSHKNLSTFVGACVDADRVCVLWDYASRGSLLDILQPDRPRLKPMFTASLTFDIIRGLTFLHDSDLRYHGNLKTSNCVVDSRWVLKLTDFGLNAFRAGESFAHLSMDAYFSRLYWTPPELLRRMLALLVSGHLSSQTHPQLLALARQLMCQGITFTLSNDDIGNNERTGGEDYDISNISTEKEEGEKDTRSMFCDSGDLQNESDFLPLDPSPAPRSATQHKRRKRWSQDRKQYLMVENELKNLATSEPSYSMKTGLLQKQVNSNVCNASSVRTGRLNETNRLLSRSNSELKSPSTERGLSTEDDEERNETTSLDGSYGKTDPFWKTDFKPDSDGQQQRPNPRPPYRHNRFRKTLSYQSGTNLPQPKADKSNSSTIVIHPGGASFHGVFRSARSVPQLTHPARIIQWTDRRNHSFNRLFHSSKKVLYGGLFTTAGRDRRHYGLRSKKVAKLFTWVHSEPSGNQAASDRNSPQNGPNGRGQRRNESVEANPLGENGRRKPNDADYWPVSRRKLKDESRQKIRLPSVRDPIGSMQLADIYAFGMVLFELHYQNDPYKENRHTPQEIIRRAVVLNDQFKVPYRPKLSLLSREEKYITDCIEACWAENPYDRPSIKHVATRLRPMLKGKHTNIMDNMMSLMENYAKELEKLVSARTTELVEEKRRTEQLLYQMLPVPVAEQLKRGKTVEPEAYDNVTIYFSDICGFTEWSSTSSPFEVVDLLNELYTRCDAVISYYNVYKVETIGDGYMVVSGLPQRNENHAGEIASMSLRMLHEIKHNFVLNLRIGIHSGPCAAGVVGTKMPRYCLFGDTVNTASRIESNGAPGRIHCSEQCKLELDKLDCYVLEERGMIPMKGKGIMRTYWLLHKTKRSFDRSETSGMDVCDIDTEANLTCEQSDYGISNSGPMNRGVDSASCVCSPNRGAPSSNASVTPSEATLKHQQGSSDIHRISRRFKHSRRKFSTSKLHSLFRKFPRAFHTKISSKEESDTELKVDKQRESNVRCTEGGSSVRCQRFPRIHTGLTIESVTEKSEPRSVKWPSETASLQERPTNSVLAADESTVPAGEHSTSSGTMDSIHTNHGDSADPVEVSSSSTSALQSLRLGKYILPDIGAVSLGENESQTREERTSVWIASSTPQQSRLCTPTGDTAITPTSLPV